MKSETKAANAMGGKTARACDSCLRKRARWFCSSDDAFLCQSCDASVHSANQLASRHERVRLQSSSFKLDIDSPPAWHRGFTRKARTPRHTKSISLPLALQPTPAKEEDEKISSIHSSDLPFVPELSNEETNSFDDTEDHLLYRVPIFDPLAAQLCNEVGNSRNDQYLMEGGHGYGDDHYCATATELLIDPLHGFLPSDIELAEYAADVESLLGRGVDEEFRKEEDELEYVCGGGDRIVKVEEEEMEGILACQVNPCLDWNFGYESSPETTAEDGKVVLTAAMETEIMNNEEAYKEQMKKNIFLRLNYEAVITAWDGQASPWTTGIRPEVNPNNGWSDFMVNLSPSLSV